MNLLVWVESEDGVQLQLIHLPVAEEHKYAKRSHKQDPGAVPLLHTIR
jgi:hypothetical protein